MACHATQGQAPIYRHKRDLHGEQHRDSIDTTPATGLPGRNLHRAEAPREWVDRQGMVPVPAVHLPELLLPRPLHLLATVAEREAQPAADRPAGVHLGAEVR